MYVTVTVFRESLTEVQKPPNRVLFSTSRTLCPVTQTGL